MVVVSWSGGNKFVWYKDDVGSPSFEWGKRKEVYLFRDCILGCRRSQVVVEVVYLAFAVVGDTQNETERYGKD